jgi:lipoprotein-anchoring transpeptidase ErfK/SrfK
MTFSGGAGKTGTNPVGARPPKDSSECKDGQKGGDTRSGGARPDIVPEASPVVAFPLTFPTSSMVIDTGGRKPYYVLPDKKAYAYPISVGREGFDWTGTETISRKQA